MKLGIALGNFSWPAPPSAIGPTVSRVAMLADDAGFDSLWTMDHFFQIRVTGEPPEAPMPEAYTTLAFVAGQTRHIHLGVCVSSVAYRIPAVLVKIVTTLDVLSGGRAIFGVGAGMPWNGVPEGVNPRNLETVGLGIPMPSLAERFERLEELLQIALHMWSGDEQPFHGRHYHLERALNSPNSLRRPHPPILVAGSGERKTLPLVARYADMCNLFDLPTAGFGDDLRHKLDVLRRHCDAAGRDYGEIEKTTSTFYDPSAGTAPLLAHLEDLAALGIDHVFLAHRSQWDEPALEALAAVLPSVHALDTPEAA